MKARALLALAAAALVAGCATSGGGAAPIDVTRYHLAQPVPAGTVTFQPQDTATAGPEFRLYANAVAAAMETIGFTAALEGQPADYLATVAFRRTDRRQVRTRPPVTIGIGGGSYGRNVGVGGGVDFGVGSKRRSVYQSELSVQIRRRGDNTVIWEGRAQAETLEGQGGAQPGDTANRLAAALFKGFPGQSGITITVK